mmetsp:Transcript_9196/g.18001  ORF Transcript_9196/g.18001 Transcript_9196/m.18001 type:complete len:297 (-) Transcript_9196:479-1369(-)
MWLAHVHKLKPFVPPLELSKNSIRKTHEYSVFRLAQRLWDWDDTRCSSPELLRKNLSLVKQVPAPYTAILTTGYHIMGLRGHESPRNTTGMKPRDRLYFEVWNTELEKSPIFVLDKPVIFAPPHSCDMSPFDLDLITGRDAHFRVFFRNFSVFEVGQIPRTNPPVLPRRDYFTPFESNELDLAIVARGAVFLCQLELDESSFPHQEMPVLRSRDDSPILQLYEGCHIADVYVSELADVSLQLQTGESLGHLPKTNVSHSTGAESSRCVWRETHAIHLLGESFGVKRYNSVFPVPDG